LAEELSRAVIHASVELNIPQCGDEKMKICSIIEICCLSNSGAVLAQLENQKIIG
jgi:hypothetical protein